jgi:hypothetical protein
MSATLQRENDELRNRIRTLEQQTARVTRQLTGAESHELIEIQARHDAAGAALGERASSPRLGESPLAYRRRLAQTLAQYSPEFKDSRFDAAPPAVMDVIEPLLHAHAKEAARSSAKPGEMIAVEERDSSGRVLTRHYGDPMAWMGAFMQQGASGNLRMAEQE